MHVHVIKWVFFCWLSPSTIPSRFFKSFMKPFRNLKHLPNYWNKNAVWSTHRCNFVNWTCGCLSIMVFWISKIYIDTWIVVLFKWLQISLKTIYFKVDLTNLNKPQICRFLPYFFCKQNRSIFILIPTKRRLFSKLM